MKRLKPRAQSNSKRTNHCAAAVPAADRCAAAVPAAGSSITSTRAASRRGASLIEMMVMMSISVVMLGLVVTTIHLLLRAERQASQSLWHDGMIWRLSRAVRDDVRAALEAEVEPAALDLTLNGDRRVAYAIDEHQLTRIETAGGAEQRREAYFLPPGSTLRFEQAAGPPQGVRLVIDRAPLGGRGTATAKTPAGEPPARRTLTIEAVLSRDRRFGVESRRDEG